MNGFVIASLALIAVANIAEATFIFGTTAATSGTTTSVLSLGTAGTAGTASALALTGGLVLLKGLALGALLLASRNRHRRSPIQVDDSAFGILASTEPAQCYRRLICDLATGTMPKSENDVIVSLFNNEAALDSPKFEFATAAKLGKQVKNVQVCEVRYSCPLSGEQIQNLFN